MDNISAELLRHYCKEVEKYQSPRGGYFTPRSYTFPLPRPVGIGGRRDADGRFAGEQLADGGLSPMLGQDERGPTAVLKSVSKLDNTLLSNGTLLNVNSLRRPWKVKRDYANWPTSYGHLPSLSCSIFSLTW
ncbi:glycine radical domain-containing protein [Shigella flexneri]